MGMTMSQKILAAHAGLSEVKAGQLIEAKLDMVLGNDVTSPVAINVFEENGATSVFDNTKIAMIMDHFTPNKDIKAATQVKQVRTFADKYDIKNYRDVGQMGIEHALLPEQGLVGPGCLCIGADSHTCTYGALGAFSTGVGSTDMAAGMISGKAWFKVPSAIKFNIVGKPQGFVSGKDVILHIIGKIGVDGALYKSMEFTGEGLKYLNIDDRLCIANMAIEAGAKNGIFPVDDLAKQYMEEHSKRPYVVYEADEDAEYDVEYTIDLSTLKPTVSFPHLPENTRTIDEVGDVKIDQVVIGSCTNGRLEDCSFRVKRQESEKRTSRNRDSGNTKDLSAGNGRGTVKNLYRGRSGCQHTNLWTMSWRIYGNPCGRRALCIYNKPKLCRSYGTRRFRSISCKPGGCSGKCHHRKDFRPGGSNVEDVGEKGGQIRNESSTW